MKLKSVILILLSAIVSSCGNPSVSRQLDLAESLLDERPDSALYVIRSIDTLSLSSRSMRAKYSLLHAAALDKNYIDTTDVGIIGPAVEYYANRSGAHDYKLESYFYQGVLYYNRCEYDDAIVSFSRAEELVKDSSNQLYVGLLYSRISDTYNCVHNAEDEYRYICLAESVFERIEAKQYYHSTLSRKGQALMNLDRYDEAEKVYVDLLNDSSVPRSILNAVKEDYALLLLCKTDKDASAALSLFEEVLSEIGSLRSLNLWAAYGYALLVCGYKRESESVFSQLYSVSGPDTSVVDIWKSSAYEENGDYFEAFSLLKNSLAYQDSLLNLSLSQATYRAHSDYLALKNTQIQLESRNKQLRLYAGIVVLLIIVMSLYLFYRRRNEKLEMERVQISNIAESMRMQLDILEKARLLDRSAFEECVSSKDLEIKTLTDEVSEQERALSQLRLAYTHMYKSQFKYLGDLSEMFLMANEKSDSQRIVYEKVREMIGFISGDINGQRRFENMVDKKLDNIMTHFRSDFPKYSEDDYRFVSCVFVGFDATTLSIIFNMSSISAVYMRKSRLKKMVSESGSVYRQNYLDMIV